MAGAVVIAAAIVMSAQQAGAEQLLSTTVAVTEQIPPTQEESSREHHRGRMSKEQFEAYRLQRLQEMAFYFGIPTEGKSARQLKQELVVAKETNKEKWEAFKAERQAKRLEHMRKIAESNGIQTEGKTAEQLHEELMKAHGGKEKRRWKEERELKRESGGKEATPSVSPDLKKEKQNQS